MGRRRRRLARRDDGILHDGITTTSLGDTVLTVGRLPWHVHTAPPVMLSPAVANAAIHA